MTIFSKILDMDGSMEIVWKYLQGYLVALPEHMTTYLCNLEYD